MWFDVPVTDADFVEVEKTPEQLVGIYLYEAVRHQFLPGVVLYDAVHCIWIVVHNNIQVLLSSLLVEESLLHFEHIYMIQLLEDLKLPIFVFFVLEHLLNSHHLQSILISTFVHYPESATAYHLLETVFVSPRNLLLRSLMGLLLPCYIGFLAVLIKQPLNQTISDFAAT